jgi:hypothetical protein
LKLQYVRAAGGPRAQILPAGANSVRRRRAAAARSGRAPAGTARFPHPLSVSKHQPSTNMAKTKTAKKVIKKAPAKKAKAKSAKKAR